jgi:uncharacterized protein YndB with AHSA1/START domain
MAHTAVAGLDVVAERDTQEVVIVRTFDASPDRVFDVYTNPALIPRWWGPHRMTTIVEEMEVRPGGRWRFVQHDRDGNTFAFRGVYHDVISPTRIVNTFEFEGTPGHVSLDTATLAPAGDRTTLTLHSIFQSVADRDGMLAAGMLDGLSESMQRIDAVLQPPSNEETR